MITILAPAYYSDWFKVRYLKESATRHNVPIHWYGFNKPYTGWFQVQVIDLLKEIKKVDTPYILYTDASDAIINTPIYTLDIIPKEKWIIMSQEHDGSLCAGGWFGPRNYAIEALEIIQDFIPENVVDIMNPQERWREATAKKLVHVFPDTIRAFFQIADEPLEIKDNTLYNPDTRTFPSIVHWAGGYTDPEIGKAALIEPYWRQLLEN